MYGDGVFGETVGSLEPDLPAETHRSACPLVR
jgi:hypothetical protein